jgi:hypothetical protein
MRETGRGEATPKVNGEARRRAELGGPTRGEQASTETDEQHTVTRGQIQPTTGRCTYAEPAIASLIYQRVSSGTRQRAWNMPTAPLVASANA